MANKAPRPSIEPAPHPSAPFPADSEWLTVADAILVACAAPGRRAFHVASASQRGCLFIRERHVVHAEYGEDFGLTALVEMLRAGRVRIRVWHAPWPARQTLRLGPEVLVPKSTSPARS